MRRIVALLAHLVQLRSFRSQDAAAHQVAVAAGAAIWEEGKWLDLVGEEVVSAAHGGKVALTLAVGPVTKPAPAANKDTTDVKEQATESNAHSAAEIVSEPASPLAPATPTGLLDPHPFAAEEASTSKAEQGKDKKKGNKKLKKWRPMKAFVAACARSLVPACMREGRVK